MTQVKKSINFDILYVTGEDLSSKQHQIQFCLTLEKCRPNAQSTLLDTMG